MLLEIAGKVVTSELFTRRFACDLGRCLGACCYEGVSGAPITPDEARQIERAWTSVAEHLPAQHTQIVADAGFAVTDRDGDLVTPLVAGRQCAYAHRADGGAWTCAIEEAWREGHCELRKPLSCHLYPIRVTRRAGIDTLDYDRQHICRSAETAGDDSGTPLFRFLREAITRAYGGDFFHELELAEPALAQLTDHATQAGQDPGRPQ